MSNPFFDQPILNAPYASPGRHWELDPQGQPTQQILEKRRRAEFMTPIPKPKKQKGKANQQERVGKEEDADLKGDDKADMACQRVTDGITRSLVGEKPVKAILKNHSLGLEIPYRYGSLTRTYLPDFIVLVNDGQEDPLHLVVEIKGYRGEDAKEKKSTMENYWIPGVNYLRQHGRWAFVEFTEVFRIESEFNQWIDQITKEAP